MDLEKAAEKLIADLGATPAFKGYYGYPCVFCTSINEEIVHGIPSEKRVMKAGDIVSIDCGVVSMAITETLRSPYRSAKR